MGESVAFFRNLNLGQRRSPTRDQLASAFASAGATDVVLFQVNGTVLFAAPRPEHTASAVVALLTPLCGYADAVIVRSAQWVGILGERILSEGFAGRNAEVSVFDGPMQFPRTLPWTPDPRRITVVDADGQYAISINREPRTSYATPTLERLLKVPVTSRSGATIVRLCGKISE